MNELPQPTSIESVADLIRSSEKVLAVGNRSKPTLSALPETKLISLSAYTGITEYEPSEFTFTARAGTPLSEVRETLAERNQYLPFDPPLVDAGATLGGTVAAGLAGPGRTRYGGVRDFLLGVRLLDGDGTTFNVGGKVVKNAAGFDIPKMLVGSLGRFGVMTDLTFKVFPRAPHYATYTVTCESDELAIRRIVSAATSRWELDAIEYVPDRQSLWLRLGGPPTSHQAIANDISQQWDTPLVDVDAEQATSAWTEMNEWTDGVAPYTCVAKIPVTWKSFRALIKVIRDERELRARLGAAGGVLWVFSDQVTTLRRLDEPLKKAGLRGLILRGETSSPWLGEHLPHRFESALKSAFDPTQRFPNDLVEGSTVT